MEAIRPEAVRLIRGEEQQAGDRLVTVVRPCVDCVHTREHFSERFVRRLVGRSVADVVSSLVGLIPILFLGNERVRLFLRPRENAERFVARLHAELVGVDIIHHKERAAVDLADQNFPLSPLLRYRFSSVLPLSTSPAPPPPPPPPSPQSRRTSCCCAIRLRTRTSLVHRIVWCTPSATPARSPRRGSSKPGASRVPRDVPAASSRLRSPLTRTLSVLKVLPSASLGRTLPEAPLGP